MADRHTPTKRSERLRPFSSIAVTLPLLVVGSLLVIVAATAYTNRVVSRAELSSSIQDSLQSQAATQASQVEQRLVQHLFVLEGIASEARLHVELEEADDAYAELASPDDITALLQERNAEWQEALETGTEGQSRLVGDVRFNPTSTEELNTTQLDLKENFGIQAAFLLTDRYGALVAASYQDNPLPDKYLFSDEDWWQAVRSTNSRYMAGPNFDLLTGRSVIEYALPIRDETTGEITGVLYSSYDAEGIKSAFKELRFSGAGRTILLAQDPRNPANAEVKYTTSSSDVLNLALVPIAEAEGELYTITITDQDNDGVDEPPKVYVLTLTPLESEQQPIADLHWYVAGVLDRDLAFAPIDEALESALRIAAVIGVLSVVLLYAFYIRPLSRSLGELRQGAEAIQQGSLQTQVALGRRDELGLLADTFNNMTQRLRHQIETQEQTIQQRTAALQRQARQLEAAAHVGRAASASLDLAALMADAVNLIRDQFGYYHASIFLLDNAGEYAVVRESTGDVGRIMKERPHKLAVGSNSLVGWATQNRAARVALNVGQDAVHFNNPLLPHTQSEVALPLVSQSILLGALDVQSTEINAFSREDVAILQLMADQIAAAITNARLFGTTRLRAQQQEEIIALSQTLNTLRRPEDIFQTACQNIHARFGYDGVYLVLIEGAEWIVQAMAGGQDGKPRIGLSRPVTLGVAGKAIQERQSALAGGEEARNLVHHDPDLPKAAALVAAPIFAADNLIGAIIAYSYAARRLDDNDLSLLQLVAGAIGSAVATAHFIADTERNLAELDRLYRQATGGEQLISEATEVIYQPDHAATLSGETAANGQHQTYETPLLSRGQVIGQLIIEDESGRWSEEDQVLADAVAGQVALALENSRLFAQTQARLNETEALFTTTNLLTTTLDAAEIYRRAARALAVELNVSRCAIFSWEREADTLTTRADFIHQQAGELQDVFHVQLEVFSLSDFPTTRHLLDDHQPVLRHVDNPDVEESERTMLRDLGQVRSLELPLVTGNQAIGIVELYRAAGLPRFSPQEIRLAQAMAAQTATALNNALLAAEAQSRVAQLSTLYRISQSLALAPDLKAVFDSGRLEIMSLTEATGMSILLLTESKNQMKWVYGYEYGAEVNVAGMILSADRGFSGHVIRTGKPLLLNQRNEELRHELQSITVGAASQAWLGVPLIVANDIIGVLSVENAEDPTAFTDRDVQLLSTVAGSIAISIVNQSLLEQTQSALVVQSQQRLQLQAAAEVSAAASSILDANELMHTAVNLIRERFTLYYVGLFLVDPTTNQAVLRAGTGEAGRLQLERGHHLEVGSRSLVGGATSDGQPRIRQDVTQAQDWRPNPLLPDTRSEVALPLRVRGQIIGALTVQSTEVGEFEPEFVSILQTMSDQLATAIDNAQLLAEAQARARRQRALNEISTRLHDTADVEQIVGIGLQALSEHLQGAKVALRLGRLSAGDGNGHPAAQPAPEEEVP
jgi:GAF domain-containing protein/HAMP domain-containing protein